VDHSDISGDAVPGAEEKFSKSASRPSSPAVKTVTQNSSSAAPTIHEIRWMAHKTCNATGDDDAARTTAACLDKKVMRSASSTRRGRDIEKSHDAPIQQLRSASVDVPLVTTSALFVLCHAGFL
jgi:hypothetical protein